MDDENAKPKKGLSDALRKALAAGVGAVVVTEEGIRQAMGEIKLPKEALNFLLSQTDKTRKDLLRAVAKEVKKYLRSSDLEKLLSEVLSHLTIEVKAEIKFKAKEKPDTDPPTTPAE